jgi:hypothetical protein
LRVEGGLMVGLRMIFGAAGAADCVGWLFDVETDLTGTPRGLVMGAPGIVAGCVGGDGEGGVAGVWILPGSEGRVVVRGGMGYWDCGVGAADGIWGLTDEGAPPDCRSGNLAAFAGGGI